MNFCVYAPPKRGLNSDFVQYTFKNWKIQTFFNKDAKFHINSVNTSSSPRALENNTSYGRLFDRMPKYNSKIVLGDFNAKVGREEYIVIIYRINTRRFLYPDVFLHKILSRARIFSN